MERIVAIAAVLLVVAGDALATPVSVNEMLVEAAPFTNVTKTGTLRYAFEQRDGDASSSQPIRLEVRNMLEGGVKQVWIHIGDTARSIGPLQAIDQNPMVIAFLQRDVTAMSARLGGAAYSLMDLVRQAIIGQADIEETKIDLGGRQAPALSARIAPFGPVAGRFPDIADKTYEITISASVPGGLWRIAADDPGEKAGGQIQSLTFEAVE